MNATRETTISALKIPTPAVMAGPSRLTARRPAGLAAPWQDAPEQADNAANADQPEPTDRAANADQPEKADQANNAVQANNADRSSAASSQEAQQRAKQDRAQATADLDAPKLLAARHLAVTTCPYLAVALHAIAIVPTYAVPTMGVDRHWRCYVNPAFVRTHAVRDLAGVWLHEVAHLVRDHHSRARRLTEDSARHEAAGRPGPAPLDPGNPRREQVRLNIAMDLEINDDLFEDLPNAATPAARANPATRENPDTPDTAPRLPDSALTPDLLRIERRDLFEEYLRLVTPTMVADHWTDCGSGAHDAPTPWEDDAAGAHPLGEHEAAAIRISVRDAIAAGRGTAPSGWRRWAERYGKAPQDWRTLLGAAFRTSLGAAAGAGDYTYRRPGRRTASLGGRLVLPSLRRPLPQVAVVIDTSGSVSDVDLGSALSEVAAITRAVGVTGRNVAVYTCDAAVQTAQNVCQTEELTLVGGGGTDLRKGIRAAMTRQPRPDVTVVLTDGHTPWPAYQPGCRVIAGIFASRASLVRVGRDGTYIDRRPPEWIETVYLE